MATPKAQADSHESFVCWAGHKFAVLVTPIKKLGHYRWRQYRVQRPSTVFGKHYDEEQLRDVYKQMATSSSEFMCASICHGQGRQGTCQALVLA